MLEPVGPLPPSVYWRRRLIVLVGVIAVVLLIVVLMSGGSSGDQKNTSASSDIPTTPTTEPAGPAPTLTVAPGSSGPPAPGQPGQGSGGHNSSGAPSPSGTQSPSPGESAPGTEPVTCPDTALQLTVTTDKPTYQVGDTPIIRLAVRNMGKVACRRDVGAKEQEAVIYAGVNRLWSSDDCYPGQTGDLRVLQPDQVLNYSVVWSGLASHPNCSGQRSRVQGGEYHVVARVGTVKSQPTKFTLK